jgi:hypothetical protein
MPVWVWIQSTGVATAIGQSSLLTGLLSAVHLVGMTVLVGGAFVSGLRSLGVLFADRPFADVAGAAGRGIEVGFFVSVVSGLLLFSPRAASAAANEIFQVKMLVLVAAVVAHVAWFRRARRSAGTAPRRFVPAGVAGLLLWVGVALAGCAYILLE